MSIVLHCRQIELTSQTRSGESGLTEYMSFSSPFLKTPCSRVFTRSLTSPHKAPSKQPLDLNITSQVMSQMINKRPNQWGTQERSTSNYIPDIIHKISLKEEMPCFVQMFDIWSFLNVCNK